MKNHGCAAIAALALLAAPAAFAQDAVETVPVASDEAPAASPAAEKGMLAGAYADVYYVPTIKFEADGISVDGDGFGARGVLPFAFGEHPLFLEGEYSRTKLDEVDQDVTNLRFGMGCRFTPMFGAYAEYASLKFNNELSGLGLHGSAAYTWNQLGLHAELGYLMLSNDNGPDVDGLEYNLGAAYAVTPRFSALADYRMAKLGAGDAGDFDLSDIRVGLRIALQ